MQFLKGNQRSVVFDLLKLIGLVCIIFAHANPTQGWFQLRNFDVPLMVMISVWLSLKEVEQPNFHYLTYIKKRFKRLVYPTWIFLIIFFLFQTIFLKKIYNFEIIISSFLLLKGIGYVWIIRIYLTVALLTPLLIKTIKWRYSKVLLVGIIGYLIYYFLIITIPSLSNNINILLEALLFDPLGYGFIVYVSIWISRFSSKQLLQATVFFGLIYFIIGYGNGFLPTQNFKYPPQLYYLSYAFMMSIGLYWLCSKLEFYKILKSNKFFQWTSQQSMWLYLWHVLTLLSFRLVPSYKILPCGLKFILLMISTFILTIIQQYLLLVLKRIYYQSNFSR